eukprot:10691339-Lingulodinium_polyedra.AAC.1
MAPRVCPVRVRVGDADCAVVAAPVPARSVARPGDRPSEHGGQGEQWHFAAAAAEGVGGPLAAL